MIARDFELKFPLDPQKLSFRETRRLRSFPFVPELIRDEQLKGVK